MVGGLLGLPLLRAAGGVGARIIIVLLLFVAVMILTGTTLIGLFRVVKKPVDMVSEGLESARLRREEERLILERETSIDVPLEEQLPAHLCVLTLPPVCSRLLQKRRSPPRRTRSWTA